jgi:hypothetical protein
MSSDTRETVSRRLIRRCEGPLRAYFGDVERTGLFFAWLATAPLGERLSRGRTLREAMRELVREHTGAVRPEAEAAFEAAWEDGALEAVRERFRAGRRIVPFLAYQQVAAGVTAEAVALRLGLNAEEVRGYVEEVERELRAERVE